MSLSSVTALRRRLALRVIGLAIAAGASGCATQRSPEPNEVVLERANFYWQYAPLAAHVYDSKGVVDGQLGMARTSQWIRREMKAASDAARLRYEDLSPGGLVALYREQRVRECEDEQTDLTTNSGAPPNKASACDANRQLDEEAQAQVQERATEPNRFQVATPLATSQCEIGDGKEPAVPIDKAVADFGWEQVAEFQKSAPVRAWTLFVPDLAIDVWRRPRSKEGTVPPVVEYAIVYRGTVGGGGWTSNLRAVTAITPLVWDQYRQARRATSEIVKQIDQLHTLSDALSGRFRQTQKTRTFITAVGHSLGAGLASFIYISNNRISRVVGFNPSPVDGSAMVKVADRDKVMQSKPLVDRDPRDPEASIFLLYERGEIISRLAPCRSGPLWGSEGGPQVSCENVNFNSGSWFKQHSMSQLACQLYLKRAEAVAPGPMAFRP